MATLSDSWIIVIVLGVVLFLLVVGIIVWVVFYRKRNHVAIMEQPEPLPNMNPDDRWDQLLKQIESEKQK
jgi:hypothetical protein